MKLSYTNQLVTSMMDAMIVQKVDRGFIKRNDGLLEDVTGQLYTVDLKQTKSVDKDGNELYTVKLKTKPVDIVGF